MASDLAALGIAYGVQLGALALASRPVFVAGDLVAFVALLPLWILLASLMGFYHQSQRRIDRSFADELGTAFLVMTVWSWFWLIGRTLIEAGSVAVLVSIVFWLGGILLVAGFRSVLHRLLRGRGWYRQSVVLVGSPNDIDRVKRRLNRHPEYALDIVGEVSIDVDMVREDRYVAEAEARIMDRGQGSNGRGRTANGSGWMLERVAATAAATGAQRVVVTGWAEELSERTGLIQALLDANVHVDLVSGEPEALCSTGHVHHLEGMAMLTVSPPRMTRATKLVKRTLDVSIAGLALALLSPLLAYIAIRIKRDSPGPILFNQDRVGRGGALFGMLKFRTMVADAEKRKPELEQLNIHAGQAQGMFKVPGDPRITPFGAWLRRWSLDELPQLWNVLTGAMSIVGPRPLIPEEAELVAGRHVQRMRVRPGITGPWQVLGRSDIPFEDMISLDYVYVATWTLREDARILIRTASAIGGARGAY